MTSVRIRSFSGPSFPAFGLNTERYGISLHIQSEYGKIRTRKTPNTDTLYAVNSCSLYVRQTKRLVVILLMNKLNSWIIFVSASWLLSKKTYTVILFLRGLKITAQKLTKYIWNHSYLFARQKTLSHSIYSFTILAINKNTLHIKNKWSSSLITVTTFFIEHPLHSTLWRYSTWWKFSLHTAYIFRATWNFLIKFWNSVQSCNINILTLLYL